MGIWLTLWYPRGDNCLWSHRWTEFFDAEAKIPLLEQGPWQKTGEAQRLHSGGTKPLLDTLSSHLILQTWKFNLGGSLMKFKNSQKTDFRKIIKYIFICSIALNVYVHFYSLSFRNKKGFWNIFSLFFFLLVILLFLWLTTAFLNSHSFYYTYFKIVILEIPKDISF